MNIFNDNFTSNNSLSLTFSGKGLNDTSNILNNYLKTGIGFQLLSNNSNYKEFVIVDTSNINSNYFASLRIALEKSQISLKSITSNNIIQPLIINSNIYITSNIGIGISNPLYDLDIKNNINVNDYLIKGVNISNIFINSNTFQTSIQNLSNATNSWIKSTSTIIYTNSNVGINKNNPSFNLDVSGDINFTGELRKNGNILNILNNFTGKYSELEGRPNITWDLNGINVYNLNSGNVGINSSRPAYRLDVNGDINFTGKLLNNKSEFNISWNLISDKPTFAAVATTGNYSNLLNTPTSGLSGIVVNWDDIKSKPSFTKVATTGDFYDLTTRPSIFTSNYSDLKGVPTLPFYPISTGSIHLSNANAGNIGIGLPTNQTPAYKLDVSGDINFTGNLRKNGIAFNSTWGAEYAIKNQLAPVAYAGSFDSLNPKPTYFDTQWSQIAGKPEFFDYDYNKLLNKPDTFKADWNNIVGRPATFFTGKYSDLINPPSISTVGLTGKYSDLIDPPVIPASALSGRFWDLKDIPALFSSNFWDLINIPKLFSGRYADLSDPPFLAFSHNPTSFNLFNNNIGNVGINNSAPTQKLDVNGNINISTGFNYMRNGTALTSSTTTFSDSRIKTNIADINDISALDMIMKIEPKNYNYIDVDERGTNNVIGFIAQQIREVIPEAVTIGEEFIPNIYKYYQVISNNSILVDDLNINKIYIGCYLKLRINNVTIIGKVIEKINKIIKVDITLDINYKCLIYGVKINDFNFIDKTYIYTLNVCATQELYRRIEEQKKEIDELKLAISKIIS